MDKLKKHYDRVLLIVIGLITLVAGSMLIMKSFSAKRNFPDVEVGSGEEFEASPTEEVAKSAALAETPQVWEQPVAKDSEKKYRLFASIPIVWKEGAPAPIDLFDESTPVREGISNKYLMEHNLPYERDDVLTLDPDGDGFSNLEEFKLGATNPNDKEDYPDATHKLELDNITATPYVVMFSNAGGKAYSIKRVDPPGGKLTREERWPTTWAELDQTFPATGPDANRFKALSYGEEDLFNEATQRTKPNVGVVTVEDTTTGERIKLFQRIKTDIPVYTARFSYDGPGGDGGIAGKEFSKGDTFKLEGTDISLKILKITANEVELESTAEGKNPKTIKRSLGAAPAPAPAPEAAPADAAAAPELDAPPASADDVPPAPEDTPPAPE